MNNRLERLCRGESLSADESRRLFADVFRGQVSQPELAALLTALRIKGESPAEIEGAAAAMTEAAVRFPRRPGLEAGEIVGTGGDGRSTINVSTTAALAAAGAGLRIVKHGNRGVSSKSGASDVLAALGIDIAPEPEESAALLDETGFAFCFAQRYHPAMAFAGPVRAALGVRTLFNILGPLTNPARPDYALIGVYDPALLETVAKTLRALGMKRAFVVHGSGLDEAAVHGETLAVRLHEDGALESLRFSPEDLGAAPGANYAVEDVKGGSPEENARIAESVLGGGGTPAQRDFVAANLALLLLAGHAAQTLPEAVALAKLTLAEGRGLAVLEKHRAFARKKREALAAAEAAACSRRAAS